MKCRKCGAEFFSLFSDVCPNCNSNNSQSLFDTIFSPTSPSSTKSKWKDVDIYDFDNRDNCSDREYMDDDDYDDFDN